MVNVIQFDKTYQNNKEIDISPSIEIQFKGNSPLKYSSNLSFLPPKTRFKLHSFLRK